MSRYYSKLFNCILTSTVWTGESKETRLVWIALLAMADKRGRVFATIPGLAHVARVSIAEAEEAIGIFMRPDKYSRNQECEGRRVIPIDGGWQLVSYGYYRNMRDDEERREYQRDYHRERREKESLQAQPVDESALLTFPVDGGEKFWHLKQPAADALAAAFPSLDIMAECRKALSWIQTHPDKRKTARGMPAFLNGWMGRAQNSGAGKGGSSVQQSNRNLVAQLKEASNGRHTQITTGKTAP